MSNALVLVPVHCIFVARVKFLTVFHKFLKLSFCLVSTGLANRFKRVKVFNFRNRSVVKFSVFPNVEVDISVAAHISFLKVSVCNFHVAQDFLNSLHKKSSFFWRSHVRFSYNFNQRSSRTVVIDVRMFSRQVERLTNVFLKVNAFNAHTAVFFAFIFDNAVFTFKIIRTEFFAAFLLFF